MKKKQIVTIDKIIPGGNGLARLEDGMVVMVPYVLPGEEVLVSVEMVKKGYAKAVVVEIVTPSQARVAPPCPHFCKCGGCDFQHVDYPVQGVIKQDVLISQLQRNFKRDIWSGAISRFRLADNSYNYRQRVRLQVDEYGRTGFFQSGSNKIEVVGECLLADTRINDCLKLLGHHDEAKELIKNSEALEIILSPLDGGLIIISHFLRKPRANDKNKAQIIVDQIPSVKSLILKTNKWGSYTFSSAGFGVESSDDDGTFVHLEVNGSGDCKYLLSLEAGGFCQVNTSQNQGLIQTMLSWAKLSGTETVLDLYCGMGNFSMPAAGRARKVVGMDLQRSAIRSAIANAKKNKMTNCHFSQNSAIEAAKALVSSGENFDLVILDPPRQGCMEIVNHMKALAKTGIIYISCDPATLARDLALLAGLGFEIEKIQAFDMFPQTHHLETVVLLRRR